MISQQGCPLWFEVVVDLSCWWAGYHEVTAVEKMQSNKQDMPLWTFAAISHGLFQLFVSSRGAEAFVRDRLPWTALGLRGSGSLPGKWGKGSLWHPVFQCPPFCSGWQPRPYCLCSPELQVRLPLCLLPCPTCRERPVHLLLSLSPQFSVWIKIVSILYAFFVSPLCWEEALFLQLQTASSWSGPKSRKKIHILSDTVRKWLMRCYLDKGWMGKETIMSWFVQYI